MLFRSTDSEAVEKIVATLGDPVEQVRLRTALTATDRFSASHFVQQVQDIVANFRE